MDPDRLLLGLRSVLPSPLQCRFALSVIIAATPDAGWGLGRGLAVGFWERRLLRQTERMKRLVGKEYKGLTPVKRFVFIAHLDSTYVNPFDSHQHLILQVVQEFSAPFYR